MAQECQARWKPQWRRFLKIWPWEISAENVIRRGSSSSITASYFVFQVLVRCDAPSQTHVELCEWHKRHWSTSLYYFWACLAQRHASTSRWNTPCSSCGRRLKTNLAISFRVWNGYQLAKTHLHRLTIFLSAQLSQSIADYAMQLQPLYQLA